MPLEGFLLGNPEHWFLFFAEPHALALSSPWPSSPWTLFLQTGETRQGGLSLHLSHHLLGPSSSRQARPGKAGPCLLLSRALQQLSPSRPPPPPAIIPNPKRGGGTSEMKKREPWIPLDRPDASIVDAANR